MLTIPTPARSLTRLAIGSVGAGALLALGATAAGAHVTVSPSTTAAGSYSVLTFSVGHGCEGSPTTTLTLQMPDEVVSITPTINPGWGVEKVMEELDEPVDNGHGGEYTERVAQVVYTAVEPLRDGFRDTFALQLQLPGEGGDTLVFPVVQACEDGENAWIQTYEDGQDEPEYPAPFFEVTAAEDSGHHGSDHESAPADVAVEAETAAGAGPVAWGGLALGAAGLAAGGAALTRSRR